MRRSTDERELACISSCARERCGSGMDCTKLSSPCRPQSTGNRELALQLGARPGEQRVRDDEHVRGGLGLEVLDQPLHFLALLAVAPGEHRDVIARAWPPRC